MENSNLDHLFRHHSGKMVSVLIRIFGIRHLETIEDAVQDTFIKASISWRTKQPENPEAWLTKVSKNRVIDLLRKLTPERLEPNNFVNGQASVALNELFLDTEIADSQLRMIFTACNNHLSPHERIAFALKTISGFGIREISSALLTNESTIIKRLQRARKKIIAQQLDFSIPTGKILTQRLALVLEVIYLMFNEGFHSANKSQIIRRDLCGEAIRLCRLILERKELRTPNAYALMALMCFNSARLPSKYQNDKLIDLEHQNRKLWHQPLIELGHAMMEKAIKSLSRDAYSTYHYESAIAFEHIYVTKFSETRWEKILYWYEQLQSCQPAAFNLLNMAVVEIHLDNLEKAKRILDSLPLKDLGNRVYLYYGTLASYYQKLGDTETSLTMYDKAINLVYNDAEKNYLIEKRQSIISS